MNVMQATVATSHVVEEASKSDLDHSGSQYKTKRTEFSDSHIQLSVICAITNIPEEK